MSDPQRLVDDPDASPLARRLLGAAAGDAPTTTSRTTIAKRLGIVALAVGGTEAGSAVAASALWWKLGIVLALLGGAAGVAIVATPARDEPIAIALVEPPPLVVPRTRIAPAVVVNEAAPVPVAVEPEPAVMVVPPAPERVVEPAVERASRSGSVSGDEPAPVPVVVEPAPAPVVVEPERPAPVPVPQLDARRLAAEVAVLDRARAAVRRRDHAAALAALDAHRREFRDGALVAEAEVVRLEVLVESRQVAAAREQARAFLVRFPSSPLGRRVRSLVDQIKETP